MKKEITKFYSEYRLYIFPAVVALSSLFLIIFAIYPQAVQLIEGQKTASELINKSKLLDIKVAALESYDEADLSRKIDFVLNALPAEKDYGNIISLLQQIITQSGFSISSLAFSGSSGKMGNLDSFEVKLEVKGPQVLLQSLLDNFDSSPRLIRIKSIDVSSNQGQQVADISLALQVLYSALPQNFGDTDTPLPELNQNDESLIKTLENITTTTPVAPESPRGKSNPFE